MESNVLGEMLTAIRGLHIHTNADSADLGELEANVRALCEHLPTDLRVDWVNLGGGYLFDELPSLEQLINLITTVKKRFGAEVFIEPGAAFVRNAAMLVSQVIDLFEVDGEKVAVLDTSVNHLPEVLEFNYQPEVLGQSNGSGYDYILAGSTCLARGYIRRIPFEYGVGDRFQSCFPRIRSIHSGQGASVSTASTCRRSGLWATTVH